MSVDVKESSRLSRQLDTGTLSRVLGVLLTELAELVALFHGHVLRYAGDGLVAYFPEPTFITNNDLGVDCAVCMQRLVKDGLNPLLQERGVPALEVRIGIDAGEAAVLVLGSARTKRHADIIGDVISLAFGIEAAAKPGEILIGATTERNLHTEWRQRCEVAPLPQEWTYRNAEGEPYSLFRVSQGGRRPIERQQAPR